MEKNSFIINKKRLKKIAIGACIMGSGGGGSFSITMKKIENELNSEDFIKCVNPNNIKNDKWLVGAACMFPPTILKEETDINSAFRNVIIQMQNWCKNTKDKKYKNFKGFKYFHPLEVGAVNSVVPIIELIQMNKNKEFNFEVIDADTAGRAIPTLPLISFAGYENNKDISWFPNYVTSKSYENDKFYSGQFDLKDPIALEEAFINLILNQFEKFGGFSLFPMQGKTLKNNPSIFYTLSDSYEIGKIYTKKSLTQKEKAQKICDYFNKKNRESKVVFEGEIVSMDVKQTGTDIGKIFIKGIDSNKGEILEIRVSNENQIAFKYKKGEKAKEPFIMGPDAICYIPLEDTEVFDNSDLGKMLAKNKKIKTSIIAISAPPLVLQMDKLMHYWKEEWELMGCSKNKLKREWLKKA